MPINSTSAQNRLRHLIGATLGDVESTLHLLDKGDMVELTMKKEVGQPDPFYLLLKWHNLDLIVLSYEGICQCWQAHFRKIDPTKPFVVIMDHQWTGSNVDQYSEEMAKAIAFVRVLNR